MADLEEIWIPLVDEPIGSIVARVQLETPEIDALVAAPRRMLAFRTFAYIRVGIALGQLVFEHDVPPYDGSEEWVDKLLANPEFAQAIETEVRAVAEEVAADARFAGEDLGPDDAVRERFRDFARRQLAND